MMQGEQKIMIVLIQVQQRRTQERTGGQISGTAAMY
jgi:hypothetical protein